VLHIELQQSNVVRRALQAFTKDIRVMYVLSVLDICAKSPPTTPASGMSLHPPTHLPCSRPSTPPEA
jgi:hypothetical protein